jgi:hypothetical protein
VIDCPNPLCAVRCCVLLCAVQLFGPYAAMKLCELSDGVLLDSLGQLDSCLSRWKELLDPITLAVVVSATTRAGAGFQRPEHLPHPVHTHVHPLLNMRMFVPVSVLMITARSKRPSVQSRNSIHCVGMLIVPLLHCPVAAA